jgi:hypothetical protein
MSPLKGRKVIISIYVSIDDRTIPPRWEIWTNKTGLSRPFFIEMPISSGKMSVMYMCVIEMPLLINIFI